MGKDSPRNAPLVVRASLNRTLKAKLKTTTARKFMFHTIEIYFQSKIPRPSNLVFNAKIHYRACF